MTWMIVGAVALIVISFTAGWLAARTWHRFDAGLRDELRSIDEERKNDL